MEDEDEDEEEEKKEKKTSNIVAVWLKNSAVGVWEVVQWVKNRPEDLHSDP